MPRSLALVLCLALLAVAPVAAAKPKPPKPPSTESLIEHAKAAVRDGTADPALDLGPMLERLRTSSDDSDQRHVLSAIEDLGRYDKASPASVKAYLREAAPPILLTIARSKASGSVRTDALMLLRDLNVDANVLDEAIALAAADTSADKQAIQFRGRLLADWKTHRPPNAEPPAPAVAGSSAKEKAALAFLREQHEQVSPYRLCEAAMQSETEVVAALLDAGVGVEATAVPGFPPLSYAFSGCVTQEASLAARLATIDLLLKHGADVTRKDGGGNTVLMGALDCPPPVVERLIAAGADFKSSNAQGFSPLHAAFAKGHWDVAELLVAKGARISKKSIDKLFFEMPTDPVKLALVRRATAATPK